MLLCAAGSAAAQGGPPLLTDDPDTPGDGHWEINLAATWQESGGRRLASLPHGDFNYGWGDRIQLKFESGLAAVSGPAGFHAGTDDLLLGVKWRWFDGGEDAWKLSTYPQQLLRTSPGAIRDGEAAPAPALFLPLEASHSFGPLAFDAELGYQQFSVGGNQWVGGVVGAWTVREGLELLGELHLAREIATPRHDLLLNLGLRQRLARDTELLFASGSGVDSQIDHTRVLLYVGLQFLIGGEGE